MFKQTLLFAAIALTGSAVSADAFSLETSGSAEVNSQSSIHISADRHSVSADTEHSGSVAATQNSTLQGGESASAAQRGSAQMHNDANSSAEVEYSQLYEQTDNGITNSQNGVLALRGNLKQQIDSNVDSSLAVSNRGLSHAARAAAATLNTIKVSAAEIKSDTAAAAATALSASQTMNTAIDSVTSLNTSGHAGGSVDNTLASSLDSDLAQTVRTTMANDVAATVVANTAADIASETTAQVANMAMAEASNAVASEVASAVSAEIANQVTSSVSDAVASEINASVTQAVSNSLAGDIGL